MRLEGTTRLIAFVAPACLVFTDAVAQASFQGLGFVTGYPTSTTFAGASRDGSRVTATSMNASGNRRAAEWHNGSWNALPIAPTYTESRATGMSNDGRTVIGVEIASGSAQYGLRWLEGQRIAFVYQNNQPCIPTAVSPTGVYVSGEGLSAKWKWGPMGFGEFPYLDGPAGRSYLECTRITDLGTGVGTMPPALTQRCVAITPDDSIHLAPASISDPFGRPICNSDASMIVAADWIWARGSSTLTHIGYLGFQPREMNENASMIVGAQGDRAAIWTPATGLQNLSCILTIFGLNVPGWELSRVDHVSADGTVFHGTGRNPAGRLEVWRAILPYIPRGADLDNGWGVGIPDGGVTIDDLLYYLAAFDQGTAAADFDDGSGTGRLDGGVTIDDLLYYLFRFDYGC